MSNRPGTPPCCAGCLLARSALTAWEPCRCGVHTSHPYLQLRRPHANAAPLPPRCLPHAVSIILAYFVCSDGASNWLLGVQLVATYCLIGFVFLLEKEHGPRGGSSNVLAAVSTG